MRRHHGLYKRSRSCKTTCLSFGANRKEDYPDHFFCHGCDLVEDAVINSMKRCPNRDTKRYRCTGGHTDLAHPTTLKKSYRPPTSKSVQHETTTRRSLGTEQSVTKDVRGSNFDKLVNLFPKSIHESSIVTPAPGRDLFSCDPQRLFTSSYIDGSSMALVPPGNTPASVVGAELDFSTVTSSIPLTCMTASSISTGNSSTNFEELEFQISVLRRRCLKLEQKNASLKKTIQQLTTQLAAKIAQRKAGPERATQHQNYKADQVQPDRDDDDDESTAVAAEKLDQRLRLAGKNALLIHNFLILIGDFILRADLANRRNFPESLLAKIIVDGVSAFEGTHSEVLRFARQHQRKSSAASNNDCDDVLELIWNGIQTF